MKLIKALTSIWNWLVGLFKSKKVEVVDEEKEKFYDNMWQGNRPAPVETRLVSEFKVPDPTPEPREDYTSNKGVTDLGTVELETDVVVTEADMKALEATGRLEQFEKDYGPKIPISMDAERLVGTPFEQPPTISLSEAINNHKPKRRYNKRKPRAGSMTEKPKVTKEETQVKAEQAVTAVKPKKKRNYYK
jgi:hypothetical protein